MAAHRALCRAGPGQAGHEQGATGGHRRDQPAQGAQLRLRRARPRRQAAVVRDARKGPRNGRSLRRRPGSARRGPHGHCPCLHRHERGIRAGDRHVAAERADQLRPLPRRSACEQGDGRGAQRRVERRGATRAGGTGGPGAA